MALVVRRHEGYYVEPTPAGPTKPERSWGEPAAPLPPVPTVEHREMSAPAALVVRAAMRVPWVFVASLALNLALAALVLHGLR